MKVRKRTVWSITALLGLSAIATGIYIHVREVTHRTQVLASLEAELQQIKALRVKLPLLEQQRTALRDQQRITGGQTVGTLVGGMTRRVRDLDVRRLAITTGEPTIIRGQRVIPLAVVFRGTYSDVFELARYIEQDGHAVGVRRLVLSHDATGSGPTIAVSLALETSVGEGDLP